MTQKAAQCQEGKMVPGHSAATVMAQRQQCVEYPWAQHFGVPLTVEQLALTHFLSLGPFCSANPE